MAIGETIQTAFQKLLDDWQLKLQGHQAIHERLAGEIEDLEKKQQLIATRGAPEWFQKFEASKPGKILKGATMLTGWPAEIAGNLVKGFQMKAIQPEIIAAQNAFDKNLFYGDVYGTIPGLVGLGAVNSVDDALSYISIPGDLPEEELSKVRNDVYALIAARGASQPIELPAEITGTEEYPALKAPINIASSRAAAPVSLNELTKQEIVKALQTPAAEKLPSTSMTEEQWKAYLQEKNYSEEDIDAEMEQQVEKLIAEALNRKSLLDTYRAEGAEMPPWTTMEVIKMSVVNPPLAVLEALDIYYKHVSMPAAGWLYSKFIPDVQEAVDNFRKENPDASMREVYAYGWQEWDAPGPPVIDFIGKYMLMEGICDPLTYAGWGFITKGLRALGPAGRALAKTNVFAGHVLEAPFDMVKWGVTKVFPKTVRQQATVLSRNSEAVFKVAAEKYHKTRIPVYQQTPEQLKEVVDFSIQHFIANPRAEDDFALAAKELLVHPPVSKKEATSWLERIRKTGVATMPADQLTERTLLNLSDGFERVFTKQTQPAEEAQILLRTLGVHEATEDSSIIAHKILADRANGILEHATDFTMAKTTGQALSALSNKQSRIYEAVVSSEAYVAAEKAGRFELFAYNIERKYLGSWLHQLNRYVIRSAADTYLTFAGYGFGNAGEDLWRSILGGVKPGRKTTEDIDVAFLGLKQVDPTLRSRGLSEMVGMLRETDEFAYHNWLLTFSTLWAGAPTYLVSRGKVTPRQVGEKAFQFMVEMPGAFSADIRRNFVTGRYGQILAETGGDAWRQLSEAVPRMSPELRGAPKWVRRNLKNNIRIAAESGQLNSSNPELIKSLKDRYTVDKVNAAELDDILNKYSELSPTVRSMARKEYKEFLKSPEQIEDFAKRAYSEELDDFIRGPEKATGDFEKLADFLTEMEVSSPQDMAELIQSLYRMQATYGMLPDEIIAKATVKSRGLPLHAREQQFNPEMDRIQIFLEKAGADIDRVVDRIRLELSPESIIDVSRIDFTGAEHLKPRIDELVKKIPLGFKAKVKAIKFVDEPGEIWFGKYHISEAGTPTIEFNMAHLSDEGLANTFYHELGHAAAEAIFDSGEGMQMMLEFSRLFGQKKPDIISRIAASPGMSYFEFKNTFKEINEMFANGVSDWIEKGKTGKWKEFLERWFPRGADKKAILHDSNTDRFLDMLTASRQEMAAAKSRDAVFRQDYFAKASQKDMKDPHFWETFYSREMSHWHGVKKKMAVINSELHQVVEDIVAGRARKRPARSPIRVVGRELSPSDVAKLMQTRNDDLARMLLDTLVPEGDKDYFIEYVMGRVREGDEGFTRESVGRVYDQIAASMQVDPASSSWFRVRQMQLESMRRDLHELHSAKLFPKEMKQAVDKYVDDAVGNLDGVMFEARVEPSPEVTKFKWSVAWQQKQVAAEIQSFTKGNENLWFHGGEVLEGKMLHEDAYITKNVDEAIEYALDASRTGEPGEAFVYVVDRSKAKVDRSHIPDLPENLALDEPIKPVKRFDVNKLYPEPKAVPVKGEGARVLKKGFGEDYDVTRQNALDEALKWYYKEYTDYTNSNMFDSILTQFYPFWRYESQRWFWLPRSFARRPGTLTAWGRWQDNTDYGYAHIPGTSIDINPARGTVYGPWSTRMMRRDYPEYYDELEGMGGAVQLFDFISRYGFYPNILYGAFMAQFGGSSGQLGGILPSIYSTPLNAMIAKYPDNELVTFISERVFPEQFRRYLTCRRVDDLGGDGSLLSAKMQAGRELTDEEQAMWTEARQSVALHSALFEQLGFARMRSEKSHELKKASEQFVEERTGYTPEQQRELNRRGVKLWDEIGGLDPWETAVLQELEFFKYSGSINPVLPSHQQAFLNRIELGWADVKDYSDSMREEVLMLQQDFLTGSERGRIGPDEFLGRVKELYSDRRDYIDNKIKEEPGMLLENRAEEYAKTGRAMPVMSPYDELMAMFFSIELEETVDPNTGERVYDWDKFWANREMINAAIPDEDKAQWDAYLQRNTAPMMQVWNESYNTYLKKYYSVWDFVLQTYSPEEQTLINEYLYLERTGQQLGRQAEIKEMESAKTGRKLISSFRSEISNEREVLRYANPHLDAWLYYWGRVSSFKTPQAEQTYRYLASRTGRLID